MLTRTRGDFAEILPSADLVVELIGGVEPAREYVLAALRAGGDVVTANKQLLSQHGEELFESRASTACSCASRRPSPASSRWCACCASRSPATPIERIHGIVNGTTNYILSEMDRGGTYARGARGGPAARLRRGRPERRRRRRRRGGEDGDPRAPGVRRAGAPRRRPLRGHRAAQPRRYRLRARAGPLAEADRHRRAARGRDLGARAPGLPVRRPPARLGRRARSTRSPSSPRRSPRSRCPAPAPAARRPRAPCSATW